MVGSIIFGTQGQSQESVQNKRKPQRRVNPINKEDYFDNQADYLANQSSDEIDTYSDVNWKNKFSENEDFLDLLEQNLHHSAYYHNQPMSQIDKNQSMKQQVQRCSPSQNWQMMSQNSHANMDFNIMYPPLRDSQLNQRGQGQHPSLSMWSKYNQRFFKQQMISPKGSKKPTKINCLKVMAERMDKDLITADNKRRILGSSILQGQLQQDPIAQPVPQKPLKVTEQSVAIRRKRTKDDLIMATQSQPSAYSMLSQAQSKMPKIYDTEDEYMMSQTIKKPVNRAANDPNSVKQAVMRAMTSEDIQRLGRDARKIQQMSDEKQIQDKINEMLDEKVKQLAPKIIQNEMKQHEKKLTVAKISDKYVNNSQIQAYILELKQQQEEIQKQQEKIFEQKIEDMKKMLGQDNLRDVFKQIILESVNEREQILQSQQLDSSVKISDSQQTYNLFNENLLQEIRQLNQNLQAANKQEVLMKSQDSFNKQSSGRSNQSMTLQDLISDSPNDNQPAQAKLPQISQTGFKINQPPSTNQFQLQPIKEEEKKEEDKIKKVEFKVESKKKEDLKEQGKPQLKLELSNHDDKSPSFGDRSEDKNASSIFQNQDSFVSESLSTPENKNSPKKENEGKKPAAFQFKANFAAPSTSGNTTTTVPGQTSVQNPQPAFKINFAAPSTTSSTTAGEGQNFGSANLNQPAKLDNPFLINKPASNGVSSAASNPFISVTPATNPFIINKSTAQGGNFTGGTSTPNPQIQPSNNPFSSNTQSQPFQNSNNNNSSSSSGFNTQGFNSQFKSPFAAGTNNSGTSKPAFQFQQSNPFSSNLQQQQPQNAFNNNQPTPNQFTTPMNTGSNGFNNQGRNSFTTSNSNGFNASQPPMNNNNNSFNSGFNNNNNGFSNNSSRPASPFNNATNFQNPPNQLQSSFNQGGGQNSFGNTQNPFNQNSNGFTAGNNNSSNPFSSNTNNNNGFNRQTPGFQQNTNNQFRTGNENNNQGMGGGGGGFNIGTQKKNTQQQNADDGDDLFATGGRKIYKAKRNL